MSVNVEQFVMCTILNFKGDIVETVGELKNRLPTVLPYPDEKDLDDDDCCLCNVDLERTAEANGLSYRETMWAEDEDYGDVFYT